MRAAHIGHMTDVTPEHHGARSRTVIITITVETVDPPSGTVSRQDDPASAFVGWLGLLQVLSQLMEQEPPAAGRH